MKTMEREQVKAFLELIVETGKIITDEYKKTGWPTPLGPLYTVFMSQGWNLNAFNHVIRNLELAGFETTNETIKPSKNLL
ncbi:MAG: hypothetical protein FVQ84_08615 [Planctomycetes bacterium]|nr:hypothetical protein [Planctomycetota bacterium]